MKDETLASLSTDVDRYASQCVKCALCLPHCPTYELTGDENESPRGRIALFQAIAKGNLPLTPKAQQHLDQCLGCRACERVCPAHVEYGALLTSGRALLRELPSTSTLSASPFSTRFLKWIVTHPKMQRGLHWLLWAMEVSGLRRLGRLLQLPKLMGLQTLDTLLPPVTKPLHLPTALKAFTEKRGTVMLFTGCITSLADQETIAASIFVLRHLGYDITVPANQTCCGAMALHEGKLLHAHTLATQNDKAFSQEKNKGDHIITLATGCHAILGEYNKHFSSFSNLNTASLAQFSIRVTDIVHFIQQCEWPKNLTMKPLPLQVVLHTPCTLRNVLKTPFFAEQMLARIPALQVRSFTSPHCCGAAGTYMLEHPNFAVPLMENLLSELGDIPVDFVASSNIGCALSFQKQLKSLHPAIEVGHPIILLAKALGF